MEGTTRRMRPVEERDSEFAKRVVFTNNFIAIKSKEGLGPTAIAVLINRMKLRTRVNKRWAGSSVCAILHNQRKSNFVPDPSVLDNKSFTQPIAQTKKPIVEIFTRGCETTAKDDNLETIKEIVSSSLSRETKLKVLSGLI